MKKIILLLILLTGLLFTASIHAQSTERVFARIVDNKIVNIEVWKSSPGIVDVVHVEVTNMATMPGKGWLYDGTKFTAPVKLIDTLPYLQLILSASEINLGDTVTYTAKITENANPNSNTITAFNNEYKLTIKNDIGSAVRVKIIFTNGIASGSISPKFPGVYTLTQSDLKDTRIVNDIILDVIG